MARLRNTFSWSASRDRLFRDCARAYWFSYYGSWGGWERGADPRTRRLYYLKNLTTLPMWIGSRVHDTVEGLIRALRNGRREDPGRAADEMVAAMRADYADSKRNRALEEPKKAVRFAEHHYGPEPPRERCRQVEPRAEAFPRACQPVPQRQRDRPHPLEHLLEVLRRVEVQAVREPDAPSLVVRMLEAQRARRGRPGSR